MRLHWHHQMHSVTINREMCVSGSFLRKNGQISIDGLASLLGHATNRGLPVPELVGFPESEDMARVNPARGLGCACGLPS